MGQERDAVRPGQSLNAGVGEDDRLHSVELAEHRESENVWACAMRDQQLSDVASADMRCRAQCRFPITKPRVVGSLGERWPGLDEFLDSIEIEVRFADDLARKSGILRREAVGQRLRLGGWVGRNGGARAQAAD